jgi:hypothetical protein
VCVPPDTTTVHTPRLNQASLGGDIDDADNTNHHKIVLDLLGPLLERINVGADDIDGASLAELADKVSKGIIGTTLAAVRKQQTDEASFYVRKKRDISNAYA